MLYTSDTVQPVTYEDASPGRATPMPATAMHAVNGHSMTHIPDSMEIAILAMGCFWGAERLFWQQKGVYSTAVGYSGGFTPNPNYREVCSGQTGHAEAVRVVFDPAVINYASLLCLFWENHDPTQGMRQGGDVGTQYRSGLYVLSAEQRYQALVSLADFRQAMDEANDRRTITTEITEALPFYYAEDDHQQYLFKNPKGYCGLGGISVCMPEQYKRCTI